MLRPINHITITQTPSDQYPTRNLVLYFDFVHKWNYSDSWRDLTSTGTLVLPKKIYARNAKTNTAYPLFGTNVNIGGFSSIPLILRGDQIKIQSGYIYRDLSLKEIQQDLTTIAEGWISRVKSKQPIEILFEDNMWKLKQIPCPDYDNSKTLESNLKRFLLGTPFTVNVLSATTIKFDTAFVVAQNMTVAQFLEQFRKQYGFESYFRGNELRCGSLVYIENEAKTKKFQFQNNICDEGMDLEYNRKDDIVLSAIATNYIKDNTGTFTSDGKAKTTRKRLEVLVTLKGGKTTIKQIIKGQPVQEAIEGERKTFFFPWTRNINELADEAIKELTRYYYEGFKGSFTTFGSPWMHHGDNASIIDTVLPERDGIYKIKGVDYSGGVDGNRQTITLDYKIN